jgi:transketolase
VAEALVGGEPVVLERMGVPDTFTESGPYGALMDKYGLSVDGIVAAAQRAIARKGG